MEVLEGFVKVKIFIDSCIESCTCTYQKAAELGVQTRRDRKRNRLATHGFGKMSYPSGKGVRVSRALGTWSVFHFGVLDLRKRSTVIKKKCSTRRT